MNVLHILGNRFINALHQGCRRDAINWGHESYVCIHYFKTNLLNSPFFLKAIKDMTDDISGNRVAVNDSFTI